MNTSSRANILLIDDDHEARESLQELLEALGHHVVGARNGNEALGHLRGGGVHPDLILLDLVMPEMNGWEFRVQQRKDASIADIPVIALTGERSAMARAIDAVAVITKPANFETLERAIAAVLENRRASLIAQTEKLAALGRLAASVAHELNNPLAFVKSNVHYLRRELEPAFAALPAEKQRDYDEVFNETIQGLERMELIVQDILLFGRTHEGAAREVDVREAIHLALKVAAGRLRLMSTELDLPHCPNVLADPSRLAQVFINLIVNAADAMESSPGERRLSIFCHAREGELAVTVRDTGPGIAADVLPKLFEPFFTTKPVGSGTGLGLFVCRGLVASMGGRIEVESNLGQGSSFTVHLPLATGAGRLAR